MDTNLYRYQHNQPTRTEAYAAKDANGGLGFAGNLALGVGKAAIGLLTLPFELAAISWDIQKASLSLLSWIPYGLGLSESVFAFDFSSQLFRGVDVAMKRSEQEGLAYTVRAQLGFATFGLSEVAIGASEWEKTGDSTPFAQNLGGFAFNALLLGGPALVSKIGARAQTAGRATARLPGTFQFDVGPRFPAGSVHTHWATPQFPAGSVWATQVGPWLSTVAPAGAAALAARRIALPVLACFAAGTPLLWEHGSKAIEFFQRGDRVWSRSEFDPAGPLQLKAVEEVFVRVGKLLQVCVRGEIIRTTACLGSA